MDRIHIKGLKVETIVGVHAWEQKLPRTLTVDFDLSADTRRAAASDALADTLDYHAIADAVVALGRASRCQLIETFAERVANEVLGKFRAESVRVTVHKPGAVPDASGVSVTIERKRG